MAATDRVTPRAPDPSPDIEPAVAPRQASRVWVWVIVVFAVQVAVWTAWFIFAAHHPVEEIPVATGSSR